MKKSTPLTDYHLPQRSTPSSSKSFTNTQNRLEFTYPTKLNPQYHLESSNTEIDSNYNVFLYSHY